MSDCSENSRRNVFKPFLVRIKREAFNLNKLLILFVFQAGACAGLAVDISLFPIDTIKTRLQSPQGFWNAGGFRQIYSGIGSTVSGSAPGAALFFFTYEGCKRFFKDNPQIPGCSSEYGRYSISAAVGETVCSVTNFRYITHPFEFFFILGCLSDSCTNGDRKAKSSSS